LAFICGQIFGDEYIESYYLCTACNVYTVEIYHDRFLGESEATVSGPVTRERGDALISIIRACPDPSDKKCACEAHKRYFEGLSG
jgi:hypothetical protein